MNDKITKKIYPVDGVKISSVSSGMYKKIRLDLSIIEISSNSSVAGVFTKNKAKSPAVIISQKNLKKSNPKFLIVNAGNANAGTGKDGYNDVIKYCESLAKKGNCSIDDILVFSTGVIGEKIKVKNIVNSIPLLVKNLDANQWNAFSQSILTTDTENKIISKKFKIAGESVTITGVTKGSGMIMPNMATMLSFVATDVKIPKNQLSKILKDITKVSFNMITVDGDTSTNDSSILIATGKSKIIYNNLSNDDKNKFNNILKSIYIDLAKKIVKDGEGATKFVTIKVDKVSTFKVAKKIAMSVANSPLVKTALFAEDPKWGRILSAIGNVNTSVKDLSKIELRLGKILIYKNNKLNSKYNEKAAKKYLKNKNIEIYIKYNTGLFSGTVWTSDLSHEYININADYRS
jgi:glutamate N-acetyltransferase/amino-acid N-acetyltransferase